MPVFFLATTSYCKGVNASPFAASMCVWQHSRAGKAPSTNLQQPPTTREIPNTKHQNQLSSLMAVGLVNACLEVKDWMFSGAWSFDALALRITLRCDAS